MGFAELYIREIRVTTFPSLGWSGKVGGASAMQEKEMLLFLGIALGLHYRSLA